MRTTLTLDDDIAEFLKEQSRLLNQPFKQVVNDFIRRGMSPGGPETGPPPFRVTPNQSGLIAGVDPRRLNQLADELEVEDFLHETAEK